MGARDEPMTGLRRRLETVLESALADSVSWTVTTGSPVTARLPDREFVFERHDSPDGHRWTVVLRAEGAVVSKFGRFETVDDVVETVESLAASDVQYTVCCDG
ncbi:hypothetical protein NDI54_10070 [Haloarcula sp. S1AR25-5A]|uniref:Uncharacterized protein n=1 Tax=Haloarcula terrestris TaxID=2950533 RepID=A0AAE4JJ43_9EURY|nr:hypothetical protein [Haloarcula terrestris]MDS0221691.1 hypothetical protein [Haloarcula terrestris]